MQNTRQMSLDPAPADDFAQLDPNNCAGVELLPVFSGVAFLAAVAYPVLVEMWEKKKSGRVKRAWLATFTEAEREKIGRYHARFHRWHLVTGTPHHVSCRLATLQLLQRAVNFFAGI